MNDNPSSTACGFSARLKMLGLQEIEFRCADEYRNPWTVWLLETRI